MTPNEYGLMPCPFCGSVKTEIYQDYAYKVPIIWCRDCNLTIGSMATLSIKSITKRFNERNTLNDPQPRPYITTGEK